jgi:single-strand DNA-binding protein
MMFGAPEKFTNASSWQGSKMQKLFIAGTIGRDAEIRRTQNGDAVAGFSVAVDNGKDKQGNKRETTWFDCSLWGKRGESLGPYLTKGTRVAIEGRPGAREYNGKIYLQCSVDEVTLLGGGQQGQSNTDNSGGYNQGGAGGYSDPASGGIDQDEVPF